MTLSDHKYYVRRINGLLLIMIISLVVRGIFLFPIFNNSDKTVHNDTFSYESISLNLIEGNGYSHCKEEPFYKDVKRTPVYPFFLAMIYGVFGHNRMPVVFFQVLLSIGIIWIVYKTGKQLLNEKAGLIAALLVGLDGHLIAYNSQVITETLFTFLLCVVSYLILLRSNKAIIFLGFLLALLILTRPIALWLVPLLIIYFLWKKVQLKTILVSSSIGILVLLPWMLHFQKATNQIGISSISSYNLYLTFANAYLAYQSNQQEDLHREKLINNLDFPIYGDCVHDYRYLNELDHKGKEVLMSRLLPYSFFHVKSSLSGLLPEVTTLLEVWEISKGGKGTLSVLNQEGIFKGIQHYFKGMEKGIFIVGWFTLLWVVTLIFSILGMIKIKGSFRMVSIVLILYFLIIPGPASTPRFLTPVVPLMCVFAACGMYWFFKFIKRGHIT